MKKFVVAAFCTLLMSGSLLAQDPATIVAPVAPVEDVADAVAPVAPVAETPATQGSFVVSPQVQGCVGCGAASIAPTGYAPMTYTQAPAGCSSCGTVAPVSYVQDCGCGAPVMAAPAADCGCAAPVATCCDPCAKPKRVGFLAKRRAKRNACCY
jgi:hypothetical protein